MTDPWTNYDTWKCHDPAEDTDLSPAQLEQVNDIAIDLQNEAVLERGWNLLDPDDLADAVDYLRAHQDEFQEKALRKYRHGDY